MATPRKPRRAAHPLQRPLSANDPELQRAAEITPEDVDRAKASWRRHAPGQFRGLLDATPDAPPPTRPKKRRG